MINGPSRQLRAYLLVERVMMEADGVGDSFADELADRPMAWLWSALSPEEKAWCEARSPEHCEAAFATPIGTPGFFDLTTPQSISSLMAQHQLDPAEVQSEVAKLLAGEKVSER